MGVTWVSRLNRGGGVSQSIGSFIGGMGIGMEWGGGGIHPGGGGGLHSTRLLFSRRSNGQPHRTHTFYAALDLRNMFARLLCILLILFRLGFR